METVQSKYKNPDKYIEKLKEQVESARASRDVFAGKHQFFYSSGVTTSMACDKPAKYPKLLPGAFVRFTGEVISVKRDRDGSEFKFELNSCFITEEA